MAIERDVDELAWSYFDDPRWPLDRVLVWIAFRRVGALTKSYEEISRSRIRLVYKGHREARGAEWVSENPLWELLKALRNNQIQAISPDDVIVPAKAWDHVEVVRRSWPQVRFSKTDIVKLWPARPKSAKGEGKPGRPTVKPAILQKLSDRIASNVQERAITAEARRLKEWVDREFPGDPRVPKSSDIIENQIRKFYRKPVASPATKLSAK